MLHNFFFKKKVKQLGNRIIDIYWSKDNKDHGPDRSMSTLL